MGVIHWEDTELRSGVVCWASLLSRDPKIYEELGFGSDSNLERDQGQLPVFSFQHFCLFIHSTNNLRAYLHETWH